MSDWVQNVLIGITDINDFHLKLIPIELLWGPLMMQIHSNYTAPTNSQKFLISPFDLSS